MTNFAKIILFSLWIFCIFSQYSCGSIQEQIDRDSKIGAFLQQSCNCDDISIASESESGSTNVNCKMTGCEFSSVEDLSDSLILGIQKEIPNICSSKDQFNLIFINKGQSSVVSFIGCKKISE